MSYRGFSIWGNMSKDELIEYLTSHGFTANGNKYRKDILVVRQNDDKSRFEVFYDSGERIPVYWYYDLVKDFELKVIDGFFTGLYDAISTFDENDK